MKLLIHRLLFWRLKLRTRRTDPLRGLTDDGFVACHQAGIVFPDALLWKRHEFDLTPVQRLRLALARKLT